jgi:hypothetical protein
LPCLTPALKRLVPLADETANSPSRVALDSGPEVIANLGSLERPRLRAGRTAQSENREDDWGQLGSHNRQNYTPFVRLFVSADRAGSPASLGFGHRPIAPLLSSRNPLSRLRKIAKHRRRPKQTHRLRPHNRRYNFVDGHGVLG